MGFGAVFATIMFIFMFASVVLFAVTIQRSIQTAAAEQQSRYTNNLKNSRMDLTITSSSYEYAPVLYWTDNLYQDFIQGTTSNTVVNGSGSVLLNGPVYSDGVYTSQAIDTGFSGTNYTTISWTSIAPAGTSIFFQARSENSIPALIATAFIGPDGTTETSYTISGTMLNTSMNNNRYIQYRAYLNTTDNTKTPELQQVRVGIERPVGHIMLNITNSGAGAFEPNQTDVYTPNRVARNSTKRVIVVNDVRNQALFDPGESMQITIFQTITTSELVTVANMAASASTTVNP